MSKEEKKEKAPTYQSILVPDVPLTDEQRKAREELRKNLAESRRCFDYPSDHDLEEWKEWVLDSMEQQMSYGHDMVDLFAGLRIITDPFYRQDCQWAVQCDMYRFLVWTLRKKLPFLKDYVIGETELLKRHEADLDHLWIKLFGFKVCLMVYPLECDDGALYQNWREGILVIVKAEERERFLDKLISNFKKQYL